MYQTLRDVEEDMFITIPGNFPGNICRRAFEFCLKYINNPYDPISHPLDKVKALPNLYNDFLDDMAPDLIVCLLKLSDCLDIPPLIQLICYKLAYLLRDMSCKERLGYFNISDDKFLEYAEM